jgi:hypothetical protein
VVPYDVPHAQGLDCQRVLLRLDELEKLAGLGRGQHPPAGVDQLRELRFHVEAKYAAHLPEIRLRNVEEGRAWR